MEDISNVDKNLWWFEKTYTQIIDRARARGLDRTILVGYYEKHHIIPRCLGGSNDQSNLVLLTYREHIICHIILTRIHPNNQDLLRAAEFMLNVDREDENGNKIVIKLKNTKIAEEIKLESQKYNRGATHPSFGTHISEEHKKILSEVNSYPRSIETKTNMANAQLGKKASEEAKAKMRSAKLGKKRPNLKRGKIKKVLGPNGEIYKNIKDAARKNNVSSSAIKGWIKREQGFSFIENN